MDVIKENYQAQQIKKHLEEKKESIINPRADDASETEEAFQEVIEEAIGEKIAED